MAKRDPLERALAELREARENPRSDESLEILRRALGNRSSHAVARAAEIIAEHEIGGLEKELVAAFDRLMEGGAESDKNCAAKTAIAQALYELDSQHAGLFLRGAKHIQMEPSWPDSVDTAGALRGWCALGLAAARHTDLGTVLVDLLVDREAQARTGAIRACASTMDESWVPLLRFKALVGDEDLGIVSECFTALIEIAPAESIGFVARFLKEEIDESTQEIAALAIGASRRAEGFAPLHGWWSRCPDNARRQSALLAIATLGQEEAFDFLLELIAKAKKSEASAALASLEVYLGDERIRKRVRQAVGERELPMSEEAARWLGEE